MLKTETKTQEHPTVSRNALIATLIVASLGYFVDLYDLVLFGVVRIPSLQALGYTGEQLMREGEFLLNVQMAGLLIGGVVWGILGDKKGRLAALFSTILIYSLANLANAFVQDIQQYALLRFIAGFGLAGELGVGITLVSEIMPAKSRGYGTMMVATFGVMGAVAAGAVGSYQWGLALENWRIAYIVGGSMGLLLLVLRLGVLESSIYKNMENTHITKGDFMRLLRPGPIAKRYLQCICIGVPIWYMIGILVFQAPELSRALGSAYTISAGRAIMFTYIGMTIGDLGSGLLSQVLRSRKQSVFLYLLLSVGAVIMYLFFPPATESGFYTLCVVLGTGAGYPAALMTLTAEQFGTNLRATATTSAPNFIRASVIPMTLLFQTLRQEGMPDTYVMGAAIVGIVVFIPAFIALYYNPETFGKALDYYE